MEKGGGQAEEKEEEEEAKDMQKIGRFEMRSFLLTSSLK